MRRRNKKFPNNYYEKKIWRKGVNLVAGIDEVGRGSFAGPVVCGAVVFSKNMSRKKIPDDIVIDDSKKVTDKQRRVADKWIREKALGWGVGASSVAEINKNGIVKATHSGFRRAVTDVNRRLKSRVEYLLIDAFYIPYIRYYPMRYKKARKDQKLKDTKAKQLAIVNGDEKSLSIAAASIIAKVYRDDLMIKLSKNRRYKKYLWDKNKGYGTKEHVRAIKRLGITRLHRKKFVEKYVSK